MDWEAAAIQVTNLNVYPNTTYNNGVTTTVGQIASESIQITIPVINNNGSYIGKIIDGVASINGIISNDLTFNLVNQTVVLQNARQAAYLNAYKKAQDYLGAAGLTLGALVRVVDQDSAAPVAAPVLNGPRVFAAAVALTPTTINVGTIAVSYNLVSTYSYS
ncbi:unnamed protein product [Sphagnum balticum]